jgi:hypothetical protein
METQQETIVPAPKPLGIFHTSRLLAKKGLFLIRAEPNLAIFPLLFGVFSIFFLVSFFVLYFGLWDMGKLSPAAFFFLWFVFAFAAMFMKIGITTHLLFCIAHIPISIKQSFKNATKKTELIFVWAIVSSFVGVILWVFPFDSYSLLIAGLLSVYWSLATYFMVPALSEKEAMFPGVFRHSIEALKRSWREMIVINAVFEFLFASVFIFAVIILRDFLILFPLLVGVMPVFAGFSFFFILLLSFSLVFLAIFAALFRTSYNLVLYLHNKKDASAEISAEKTPAKKPGRKKLIQEIP